MARVVGVLANVALVDIVVAIICLDCKSSSILLQRSICKLCLLEIAVVVGRL